MRDGFKRALRGLYQLTDSEEGSNRSDRGRTGFRSDGRLFSPVVQAHARRASLRAGAGKGLSHDEANRFLSSGSCTTAAWALASTTAASFTWLCWGREAGAPVAGIGISPTERDVRDQF